MFLISIILNFYVVLSMLVVNGLLVLLQTVK